MENFLVFSTRSDLRRISIDTPDQTDVVIPLVNVVSAVGLDFDAHTETIYWTDTGTDTISRAHWDGSDEAVRYIITISYKTIIIIFKKRSIYKKKKSHTCIF